MWLDRLSGHSTPAATPSASPPPPTNRSYSPAARRPSHLGPAAAAQRPGFNPRSSSLSLNSNDSTTSLLASSRRPNGSGLRQSVTVADAPDPLEVLEKLLGSEGKGAVSKSQGNGVSAAEEDFELELDFEGLGLREFASRGSSTKKEHVYATQTVEECRFCSQPYGMMLILHDSRTRQSEV
jgi:vacuolar protein sorting-associated protein 52